MPKDVINAFDLGILGWEYKKTIQNKSSSLPTKKKEKNLKDLTEEEKEYNKDL
ncbi:hypothetical protein [Candidatus Nitrosocosmicus sp. R]